MSQGTVPITGTITTTSELDTYPTHWDKYARGGHRSVVDTIERDAITLERRTEGMQVYIRDIRQLHQLIGGTDNTKWVTLLTIDMNNKIVVNNDLNLQKYIIEGAATELLPNAISLGDKPDGYLINSSGKVITTNFIDPAGISLSSGKLLIGDINNKAIETETLKMSNLPTDLTMSGMVKYNSTSSLLTLAIEDVDYATVTTLNTIAAAAQKSADAAAKSASDADSDAAAAAKSFTGATAAAGTATTMAGLADTYAKAAGASATEAAASVLAAAGFANAASSYVGDASDYADTAKAASKVAGERMEAADKSAISAASSLDKLLKTGLNELPNSGDVNFQGWRGINAKAGVSPNDFAIVSQITDITDDYVKTVVGTKDQIVSTGTQDITLSIAPTYEGQSSIKTLGTITTGTWNGSAVPMSAGGTNAALTASNGGILYSTGSKLAILSGTASTNQLLISGAKSAPSWTSSLIDFGSIHPTNSYNLFIGTGCGSSLLISGVIENTGVGINSLQKVNASYNSAFGSNTLAANTSGAGNSAFGNNTLLSNTTGILNSAFGITALAFNTIGSYNAAFGQRALENNISGNNNSAFGSNALVNNTTGIENVAFGMNALDTSTTGSYNTAFGGSAGHSHTIYNSCTFLGYNADAAVSNLTNAIAIGYRAQVSSSNTMVLGGTNAAGYQVSVGIGIDPIGQLQLPTIHSNRKIVLYQTGLTANDHQIFALGTSTGIFRFQVDNINYTGGYTWNAGVNATTSNELMRLTGTGFLGIGTSTPHAPLQFSQDYLTNRKIVLYEAANNEYQFYGFGVNNGVLRYQVDNIVSSHVFYAATSESASKELMRINGNGVVGIGTTSTVARLVVAGINTGGEDSCIRAISPNLNAKIELHATSGSGRLWELRSNNSGFFDIVDRTGTVQRLCIDTSGRVGIGTGTPDQLLTVNSSTPSKVGAGSWAGLSDGRIKDVVGDYEHGLAEIIQINPKRFKYNDKSGYPDSEKIKVNVGIIAQDIEDIFPECIVETIERGDIPDMRVYDSTALTYALINSIKELNQKVNSLESRLSIYENR